MKRSVRGGGTDRPQSRKNMQYKLKIWTFLAVIIVILFYVRVKKYQLCGHFFKLNKLQRLIANNSNCPLRRTVLGGVEFFFADFVFVFGPVLFYWLNFANIRCFSIAKRNDNFIKKHTQNFVKKLKLYNYILLRLGAVAKAWGGRLLILFFSRRLKNKAFQEPTTHQPKSIQCDAIRLE